jgi:hypothetical protein
MRRLFTFLMILLFAVSACGPQKRPNPTPTPSPSPSPNPNPNPNPTPTPDPTPDPDAYQQALNSITIQELKDNLGALAGFNGRATGTVDNDNAAAFILEKFKAYGLHSEMQKFSASGKNTQNVIGLLDVSSTEYVVVGAHFDHLGAGFPGADDNASGTSAIVELAEALSKVKPYLKRNVIIVAFSAEEMGLLGSEHYVGNAPSVKTTRYMVNLDMVGYLRNKEIEFLGAGSNTKVSAKIKEIAQKNYPDLTPNITNDAGGGSDHVPFIQAGIPAMFLHTGIHENYHTANDTADKINYEGLTSISKISFELVYWLSTGDLSGTYETLLTTPGVDRDHGKADFIR